MENRDRHNTVLPADELGAVMELARRRAQREDPDFDNEDPEELPAAQESAPTLSQSAERFAWLGAARSKLLDDVASRSMLASVLDWVATVAGGSRATAVFHTAVGKIRLPVMQYVYTNDDHILVLMLDPGRLSFHPVQGTELMFSLEHGSHGAAGTSLMTVLSGPWAMPGFPVAFLMLWDQATGMDEPTMVKDAKDRSAALARLAELEDERETASLLTGGRLVHTPDVETED